MKCNQKYPFSIQSWTPYSTRETSEALQENKSIVLQWLQTGENTKTFHTFSPVIPVSPGKPGSPFSP